MQLTQNIGLPQYLALLACEENYGLVVLYNFGGQSTILYAHNHTNQNPKKKKI